MVTLQIVRLLRFGELIANSNSPIFKPLRFGAIAVNSNSPIFSVVKLWRVSPIFMYTECFLSLQHVLQNACFCVVFVFCLVF